jgi:hypothetical protein
MDLRSQQFIVALSLLSLLVFTSPLVTASKGGHSPYAGS